MLHEIVATLCRMVATSGIGTLFCAKNRRCESLGIVPCNITLTSQIYTKAAGVGVGYVLVLLQSEPTWLRSANQ